MQRWEYRIVTIDDTNAELGNTLERLGNDGWELVSTIPKAWESESSDHKQDPAERPRSQLVFKRPVSPPDTYDLIREAILNKQQVIATYQGHRRALCPHVLGVKGLVRHALFYQFGGTSEHRLPPDGEWRCMNTDHLLDVTLREGQWHTRDDYDEHRQSCVDTIDIAVELIPQ